MSSNDIEFRSVSKQYGSVAAVRDIDLAVPKGAFLAILGPSGCGKTTCLRMIGGFEQPTSGTVTIAGADMSGVPAYRRPVNMVFQHYALFPHFDVAKNVAYGLRQMRPRLSAGDINRRVDEALEMVRLTGFRQRMIHEMSGGQQQRVALARALVNRPAVLLLDEPLAALDKNLRGAMQLELQNLQRELGITFVLVTHDQEEALSMSDLVCVMNGGRIIQLDKPQVIYDRPADLFVACFVGKTNQLAAQVAARHADGASLRLANGAVIHMPPGEVPQADSVVLSARPELIGITAAPVAKAEGLIGRVHNRIFLGNAVEYAVHVDGIGEILATTDRKSGATGLHEPGAEVTLTIDRHHVRAFAA